MPRAASIAAFAASSCAVLLGGAFIARSFAAQDFTIIERGRYLATVADCAACHTTPGDGKPFAGGRPIETPFGNVLSPNITPDQETGIGRWSDAEFDAAMREGEMPNGKLLYPAMPYFYYAKMTKEDVKAIRAYLATVAPVHNPVESNQLPFPFDMRVGMHVWDALYFDGDVFKPDSQKSAEWNRGAYLVEGAGHCGACHTPKNFLGGDKSGEAFHGYSIQGWFAPDITNDQRHGLGAWSKDDIVDYLKTGHNRFAAAAGPMAEEVSLSSSRMNDGDLQAIATYLKNLPPHSKAEEPLSAKDTIMQAGGAIYHDLCSACHKQDGTGVPGLFPNLAALTSVASSEPTSILRVVLDGTNTVATAGEPTSPAMPAYGWQLTNGEVAAVATYIRNSWGHQAAAVSASDVKSARKSLVHSKH